MQFSILLLVHRPSAQSHMEDVPCGIILPKYLHFVESIKSRKHWLVSYKTNMKKVAPSVVFLDPKLQYLSWVSHRKLWTIVSRCYNCDYNSILSVFVGYRSTELTAPCGGLSTLNLFTWQAWPIGSVPPFVRKSTTLVSDNSTHLFDRNK